MTAASHTAQPRPPSMIDTSLICLEHCQSHFYSIIRPLYITTSPTITNNSHLFLMFFFTFIIFSESPRLPSIFPLSKCMFRPIDPGLTDLLSIRQHSTSALVWRSQNLRGLKNLCRSFISMRKMTVKIYQKAEQTQCNSTMRNKEEEQFVNIFIKSLELFRPLFKSDGRS